jgi:putative FmdB family regulatory protein
MPIYEYRCENCGEISEFIILGKQEQLKCKQCGSEELNKVISAHNTAGSAMQTFSTSSSSGCCGAPGSCGSPGSCCSG